MTVAAMVTLAAVGAVAWAAGPGAADADRGAASAKKAAGPVVVEMVPKQLAEDVDPALAAVKVTFDQPMHDRSWSWTGGGETFPKVDGDIHYDAARTTCVLPVKLEAGKVYWIGINSPSHKNFASAAGAPALVNVVLFATRGADGKPTVIPAAMKARAAAMAAAIGQAAPTVVKTTPEALADDVKASVTALTVTFDQPMRDGSWSWTGGGDTFPKVTGKIHYDAAKKTCTLPVTLEPGKVYVVGINSPSHQNFANPAGVAARRYLLVFATAGRDGKATAIPQGLRAQTLKSNEVGEDL
jgi:hypothetical protein